MLIAALFTSVPVLYRLAKIADVELLLMSAYLDFLNNSKESMCPTVRCIFQVLFLELQFSHSYSGPYEDFSMLMYV